jgi:carbon storage regulator
MLLLNRGVGERFFIGEDILVQVVGFRSRRQITIGIAAPDEVKVHREEMYRRIFNRNHPISEQLDLRAQEFHRNLLLKLGGNY